MWVQECRVTGRLAYHKVLGSKNPSDVLTKHVPGDLLDKHLETIGARIAGGRAETAPEICALESWVTEVEWEQDIGHFLDENKKVSFARVIKLRGIPSHNSGRKCGKASERQSRAEHRRR